MKDIPLFTTQYGVASLGLKELPYTGRAFVRIQDSAQPKELLNECLDFCRAVGAEAVYATGHTYVEGFDRYCRILRMRCSKESIDDTDAALFPVTEKTLEEFRDIYNKTMRNIPGASYMSMSDSKKLLEKGNGYFIHKENVLLGIGIAGGNTIDAVVSLVPGAGKTVMQALCHAIAGYVVEIDVAEENIPAMRLYGKMGFIPIEEVTAWYKTF